MRHRFWLPKRRAAGLFLLVGVSLAAVSLIGSCLNPRPEDFPSADESAMGSDTAGPTTGNPDSPGLGGDLLPDTEPEGNGAVPNDPSMVPIANGDPEAPPEFGRADAGVEPPVEDPDGADGGTSDGG